MRTPSFEVENGASRQRSPSFLGFGGSCSSNVVLTPSPTRLDLRKIDKNNETLLGLRSWCVTEQKKLQDAGGEDDANESDLTNAAEKKLPNDEETNLRGKEV